MAVITLNIPDAQLPRIINGLCALNGVPATGANAKQVVVGWVTAMVLEQERLAAQAASLAGLPGDPGLT
jgi:hypothetical protein